MVKSFFRLVVGLAVGLVVVLVSLSILSVVISNAIPSLRHPGAPVAFWYTGDWIWSALATFLAPLFVVLVFVAIALLALRIVQGKPRIRGEAGIGARETDLEDSRIMQELYHSLSRMEERIEALETLLLERPTGSHSRR